MGTLVMAGAYRHGMSRVGAMYAGLPTAGSLVLSTYSIFMLLTYRGQTGMCVSAYPLLITLTALKMVESALSPRVEVPSAEEYVGCGAKARELQGSAEVVSDYVRIL